MQPLFNLQNLPYEMQQIVKYQQGIQWSKAQYSTITGCSKKSVPQNPEREVFSTKKGFRD